jgi:hypothetical protein
MKRRCGAAIGFIIVSGLLVLSACDDRPDAVFPKSSETLRVTAPNGQLDAVLVTDTYGPAAGGGVDSNVYIVLKGASVHKSEHPLFRADPMTGGKLVWGHDHFLEIHYDIANIHEFRNLWGLREAANVGSTGERDFMVEIRLVPANGTSALTPNGSFRSPGYD